MRSTLGTTVLRFAPYSSLTPSLAAPPNCCNSSFTTALTRRPFLLLSPSAAQPHPGSCLAQATSKSMQAALPRHIHQSHCLPRPTSGPCLSMPRPSCLTTRQLPSMPAASRRPVIWQSGSLHSSKAHLGPHQCTQQSITRWQHSVSSSKPTGRSLSPPSAAREASNDLPLLSPDAAPAPDAAPPADVEEDKEAAAAAAILAAEAEQHKQRVRDAVVTGQLGFGFSAGGFLYCYHLGVLWELERLGVLRQGNGTLMAGASAGSLAIATFNSGISRADTTSALRAFAHDCRTAGTRYRLSGLLREFLHLYLPSDAHERCSGVCHVSLTRVPSMRHEAISQFHDKADLVEALLTSCHIPVYASGAWTTQFRGSTYVDGGITHFVPSPPSPTVIKVCCFPVSQLLASLKPTIKDMRRASSLMSIAVSPDAYEACEPSFRTLVKWALVPAEDEVLDWLMDKGRRDAYAWAQSMGLTDLIVQPSAVLVP